MLALRKSNNRICAERARGLSPVQTDRLVEGEIARTA